MATTTLTNPVIWADVPDIDVIRVADTFYMVSTSMHTVPGCPIMRSRDLKHWELVSYVFAIIADNDEQNLRNGKNIYGKGSWAASLRYHNDAFYVCFSCNDTDKFYVYQTKDIASSNWSRSIIDGLHHDPALLFDDDRVYVIYGVGDIRIQELTADATAVKPGGVDQLLLSTKKEGLRLRCEGGHAYKIDGRYYLLFIEWTSVGNQRRRQVCYRADALLGEYERQVIFDDDMGYHNKGIAQGAIFDTPNDQWYAMLFQDHDAVGRIPYILPVSWQDGWPMIGVDGKAPAVLEVDLPPSEPGTPLVVSDDFESLDGTLKLNWQWNHNPDHASWSLQERPGYLRLRTGSTTDTVLQARNTLTQRTEGPACVGETKLDVSALRPGDYAGLIALQSHFGTVGVRAASDGSLWLEMCINDGTGGEKTTDRARLEADEVLLRIVFNFEDSIDEADFFYSLDGITWLSIGDTLQMKYTLDHFMGYRVGLFCYASRVSGGNADFAYFGYRKLSDIEELL